MNSTVATLSSTFSAISSLRTYSSSRSAWTRSAAAGADSKTALYASRVPAVMLFVISRAVAACSLTLSIAADKLVRASYYYSYNTFYNCKVAISGSKAAFISSLFVNYACVNLLDNSIFRFYKSWSSTYSLPSWSTLAISASSTPMTAPMVIAADLAAETAAVKAMTSSPILV